MAASKNTHKDEKHKQLARLGKFIHENFPRETKEIAAEMDKDCNIIDVAMELLIRLDTAVGIARHEVEKLQKLNYQEIAKEYLINRSEKYPECTDPNCPGDDDPNCVEHE